ncbi:GPR1/FUN34/YaaH family transporter [Jatrophihabitans endophyticus]|uniref:GPR1/FUN34/YaaH family transporter n=1 Tax=Jatrophihabitans endophyticus TaxID=1206085 RepID=UPI0019E9F07D|nr:GPR1/FUN34/YaaH family transporter [Jatrophihabitans endophyticus]MBE7189224.1 hypothetical protein [Jatrophihabitans endophyticus]
MTAVDPSPSPSPGPGHAPDHAAPAAPPAEPAADRFASPVPVANPALVGVPTFMVGSIALGLVLTGFVPSTLAGAPIAIIALATGMGQLVAMLFALRAGESAVASVFGIFGGFWLSYAALVLGILHNWYGLTVAGTSPAAAAATGDNILGAQKVFLLSWLILIVLLTLVSLRLPLAFTVLFVLVDIALLFVYLGTVNASSAETTTGGWFVFSFVAVGAYLFLDAMTAATGGNNLPLGPPVLR